MLIDTDLTDKINDVVDFIYDNDKEFLKYFLHNDMPDEQSELLSLSISPERIKFVAVLPCGQHVGYDCSITDYNDWVVFTTLKIPTKTR